MARALLGYVATHAGHQNDQLLAENARLRRRVNELEAELAELRAAHTRALDDELHRLTGDSQPALA